MGELIFILLPRLQLTTPKLSYIVNERWSRPNEASFKAVRLVGFPWIRPVIHPAGLIGSGYLKIFRIKRIIGLGYFIKNNKITESLNSRSGKCERPAGGNRRVKEPEWEMWRIGRGDRRVKEPEWEMPRTGRGASTG